MLTRLGREDGSSAVHGSEGREETDDDDDSDCGGVDGGSVGGGSNGGSDYDDHPQICHLNFVKKRH